ncbi:cyclic nucleotide-binding domain-containing protein [Dehalobacter sp. DCM]|uniref:cyclic nucleotide-binding domain-containing protein n=1 Tax=Dehalobacter sp. DCM TaxID=2907827 RepID=UPI003081BC42|nr:cyclic nucleotide-binding domain-containing protein [Dehalobacter sp. DCM]
MQDEILSSLSKVTILDGLSTHELFELKKDFQWETFTKEAIIIEEGQKAQFLYLLVEGQVEINSRNQDYNTPQTFGPGQVFGDLSLVTGSASFYTAHCLEPCRFLRMTAEDFARMLLRWPRIYQTIIIQLSEYLNEANQMLSEKKYKEVLSSVIKLTEHQERYYGIWGSVRTTSEVEQTIEKLVNRVGNLLIRGERGTGRQMIAWHAHQRLFGETAPFVVVDGRRFEQQWEGLLSKTGTYSADSSGMPHYSLFDIALGGTIFIHDIDQISIAGQLKLAELLQYHKNKNFIIGSIQTTTSGEGQVVPELQSCFMHTHYVKPLRERKRDIPIITQGILEMLAQRNKRVLPSLTPEAMQLLLSHHYRQGNVNELIQVIERAFFLALEDVIGLEQIFFGPTSEKIGRKINLLQWSFFNKFFKESSGILWLRRISAVLFIVIIVGMITPLPISPELKVLALIWGLWWPIIAVVSPFLGRIWCTVCPFSTIMDFFQNRFHPKRTLPAVIVKYDYLIVSILFVLIFWIEVVSHMRYNLLYTGILLIVIQLAAICVSILYPRHNWCRHFCPLGGFIGVASIGSFMEVRADATVCLNKCTTLECYVGKGDIKGCPMSQHLPYLDNNLDCKLCFNCLRICPHHSVQVNIRIPAREVWHLTRINQGYVVFIGVILFILFPLNYFESLREVWSADKWLMWFSAAYITCALLGGVCGWWIGRPFKTKGASTRIKLVFAVIPLVIAGHIIYQARFIPGIDTIVLGLGSITANGFQSVFVPVLQVFQVSAALIGLLISVPAILIVLYRRKK